MYGIPAATTALGLLYAFAAGMPGVFQMGYLAASLCCIGGITGLASQKTARIGNALGLIGVSTGMITALCALHFPLPLLMQALTLVGLGGAVGTVIGRRVAVTELPQTVAAFHALVGIAAVMTSISSFYIHPVEMHTALHKIAAYLGTLIGGITFTGSIAAFLKLSGYKTGHLNLPYGNYLNQPLGILNLLSMIAFVKSHTIGLGSALLLQGALSSFVLGWNITNSIGSADMPVAITVLNSYSGWALCA